MKNNNQNNFEVGDKNVIQEKFDYYDFFGSKHKNEIDLENEVYEVFKRKKKISVKEKNFNEIEIYKKNESKNQNAIIKINGLNEITKEKIKNENDLYKFNNYFENEKFEINKKKIILNKNIENLEIYKEKKFKKEKDIYRLKNYQNLNKKNSLEIDKNNFFVKKKKIKNNLYNLKNNYKGNKNESLKKEKKLEKILKQKKSFNKDKNILEINKKMFDNNGNCDEKFLDFLNKKNNLKIIKLKKKMMMMIIK